MAEFFLIDLLISRSRKGNSMLYTREVTPMMYRIMGIGLLGLASLYLLSLLSYDPFDPSWFLVDTSRHTVHNLLGKKGATVASFSFQLLGNGAFVLCAGLLTGSGLLFMVHTLYAGVTTSFSAAPEATDVFSNLVAPLPSAGEETATPDCLGLSPPSPIAQGSADSSSKETIPSSEDASLLAYLYLDRPQPEPEKRYIKREELLQNTERWLQSRKTRSNQG
jgi:hypothetical protein